MQELLNKAYQYEMEEKTEENPEYLAIIRQITEKDPLNCMYVETYAQALAAQGSLDLAQEQFEKSIRYNSA